MALNCRQDSNDWDSWRLALSNKLLQTSQLHFRSLPNLKSLWLVSASVQNIIITTLLGEILRKYIVIHHASPTINGLPPKHHWILVLFGGQNFDRRLGWCGGHLRVMSKLGVAFPLQAMIVTMSHHDDDPSGPSPTLPESWSVAGPGWSPAPKSFLLQLENPAVWDLEPSSLEVWAPTGRCNQRWPLSDDISCSLVTDDGWGVSDCLVLKPFVCKVRTLILNSTKVARIPAPEVESLDEKIFLFWSNN